MGVALSERHIRLRPPTHRGQPPVGAFLTLSRTRWPSRWSAPAAGRHRSLVAPEAPPVRPVLREVKPLPFVYIHDIAVARRPRRVVTVIIWMLITEIVAPFGAQQICPPPPPPPPAPRLDSVDQRIVDAVRDVGPVKTWSLLNWLAEDEGARSRADGREARRSL
jgi:hypothetical protein